MASTNFSGAPTRADHPASAEPMSRADQIAHEMASYVRPTARPLTTYSRRDVRNTMSRVTGR